MGVNEIYDWEWVRVRREEGLVMKNHEEYQRLRRAWEGDLSWKLAWVSHNLLVWGLYVSAGILLFGLFVKRCIDMKLIVELVNFSLIDADE